jgi:hypothetical protein
VDNDPAGELLLEVCPLEDVDEPEDEELKPECDTV